MTQQHQSGSPIVLHEVIPWGRSLAEYRRMFSLSDDDLDRSILGCGDGPASFNAEWTALGGDVISIDPIYVFSGDEILGRFNECYPQMLSAVHDNREKFAWTDIASPDEMGERRRAAMMRFLDDYEQGKTQDRYRPLSLPKLPFADSEFDLALCSHLLFTYSHLLDDAFHLAAALEMARVACEVRIFPLLTLNGRPSPQVEHLKRELPRHGKQVDIVKVNYEFQIGGNEMMVIV